MGEEPTLAAKMYHEAIEQERREKLAQEQRDEATAWELQDRWQAETDRDRAARERSDERVALRYNAEELAGVKAGSLALNRGQRSSAKKHACDACGSAYTVKSSLRRHQQSCLAAHTRHRLLQSSSDEDGADDTGLQMEQPHGVNDGNGDGSNGGSEDDDSNDDDSYESHYPLRS